MRSSGTGLGLVAVQGRVGSVGQGRRQPHAERCPVQPAVRRRNGNHEVKAPDTRIVFTARSRNGHENNPPDLTRQLMRLLSFSSGS